MVVVVVEERESFLVPRVGVRVWGWVGISVQNRSSCRGPGKLEEGRLTRRGAFYVFDGGRGGEECFLSLPRRSGTLVGGGRGNGGGASSVVGGGGEVGKKKTRKRTIEQTNKKRARLPVRSRPSLSGAGRPRGALRAFGRRAPLSFSSVHRRNKHPSWPEGRLSVWCGQRRTTVTGIVHHIGTRRPFSV